MGFFNPLKAIARKTTAKIGKKNTGIATKKVATPTGYAPSPQVKQLAINARIAGYRDSSMAGGMAAVGGTKTIYPQRGMAKIAQKSPGLMSGVFGQRKSR